MNIQNIKKKKKLNESRIAYKKMRVIFYFELIYFFLVNLSSLNTSIQNFSAINQLVSGIHR